MKKIFSILLALVMVLSLLPTVAWAGEPVAKIGEATYETLLAAIKAAEESNDPVTIEILRDSTESLKEMIFSQMQVAQHYKGEYTIDLQGHTVTLESGNKLDLGGTKTLMDSVGGGKICRADGSVPVTAEMNQAPLVLTFKGGTYSAETQEPTAFTSFYGFSGAAQTGYSAVINVEDGTFNGFDFCLGTLNISGGIFTGYFRTNHDVQGKTNVINISGGDFTGCRFVYLSGYDIKDGINPAGPDTNGEVGPTVTITGGSFPFDPTEYVDTAVYNVTNNGNNTWTVAAKPAVAQIGKTKYTSFTAAFDAAKEASDATTAATIDLLADVTVIGTVGSTSNKALFMVEGNDNIIINGNGHSLKLGNITNTCEIPSGKTYRPAIYVFNVRGSAVFNGIKAERLTDCKTESFGGIINVAGSSDTAKAYLTLNNCNIDLIKANTAAGETWGAFPVNTSDNSVVTVNGGVYTGGKANGEDNKGFSIGKDTSVLVFNSGTTNGIHVDSCAATVTVVDGKFNGTQPLRVDGKNSSAKNVSVSGGLFAARPDSKCIASGKAILVNDDAATKTAYPFQVAEAPTAVTVAEVTKGADEAVSSVSTGAKKPGSNVAFTANEVEAATAAQQAITTNTNSADLNVTGVGVEVAATQVAQKNTVKGADTTFTTDTGATSTKSLVEAVNATKATGTGGSAVVADDIAIVVQTYTKVEVVDVTLKDSSANKIQSITYDIQPMAQKIATTEAIADSAKNNVAAIKTEGDDQNAVKVGQPEKLEVTETVNMTIPLPANFVDSNGNTYSNGAKLYVEHDKEDGTTYVYEGTVTNTSGNYSVSFVNPNGFSTFTLTAEADTVASVVRSAGDTTVYFKDLQSAVDYVADGGTVTLMKDSAVAASVGRTVSFTFNMAPYSGQINAGANTVKTESGTTYTFTYTAPVPPAYHGGGSYTPSAAQTITTDLPAGSITKVTVDGKTVDSKYYTISGGNVTLTDAYIKTLSNGKHTVAIENATHISKATITVNNAANAATVKSGKTGDAGILLYGALAVSSVLGMGWVGKKKIH